MRPASRFLLWIVPAVLFLAGKPSAGQRSAEAVAKNATGHAAALSAYRLEKTGDGIYAAKNAAHHLALQFDAREARLTAPQGDGGLRMTRFGYRGQLRSTNEATLRSSGNRIAYQRDGFTEWYVNDANGLEQGFTFPHRLENSKSAEPLVIAMAVTGGLRPELSADGRAVILHSDHGPAFRYAGLRSWDARGREMPAHLEADGREIRLVVQDRDAEYPLVIDPVLTTVVLTPSTPDALGQVETLTATTPGSPTATGKMTFYDGTNVLGVANVAAGTAALSTTLLPAGPHSLTAYYGGDMSNPAGLSAAAPLTVTSLAATDFGPVATYGANVNPQGIATGLFNADNFTDLAVANAGSNDVSILLGNGFGSFTGPMNFPVGVAPNMNPYAVAVGDFNQDGFADLAVANKGTNNVSILLGTGTGSFGSPSLFMVDGAPVAISVADFNADGKPDLVVVNSGTGDVSVLIGDGLGGFAPAKNYSVGANPQGIAIADFNGDGAADLAVVNTTSNTVSILLGNLSGMIPTGTFQSAVSIGAGSGPRTIVAGQFNVGGNIDLAVGDNLGNITVLLGDGTGGFPQSKISVANSSVIDAVTADFNADGKLDLAVTVFFGKALVLLGNGDGTFQPPATYVIGGNPDFLVVGEFNGDQTADLATADFNANNVSVLLGIADTITATSGGGQITKVNTAFGAPLVATVKNSSNVGVPGVTVTFTAPSGAGSMPTATFGGQATTTAVTDAFGKATSPIPAANSTVGTYNVTADTGFAMPVTFSLTNSSGPANITALTSAQTTAINTVFGSELVANVTDSLNHPLQGVTVIFNAPTSGASALFGANPFITASTDASGNAHSGIFQANGIAGAYTITARALGLMLTANFSLTNKGPILIANNGTLSTMIQTGYPLLSVTAQDAVGNPVPNVIVTFTAPPSGPSGTFALGTNTAMTNGSGVATSALFTANSKAGPFTVTTSATGYGPANFSLTNLVGPAISMTATGGTPQAAVINSPFAIPLSATVTDAGNNGVPNVLVTFNPPPSAGASGAFLGGVNTAMTNASGVATSAQFIANGNVGPYLVGASALALSTSFSLSNVLGIQLPVGLTVGLGVSAPFTVTLGTPAPPGGVFVSLMSSDTSKVSLISPNVLIPAGQTSAGIPKVFGNAFGTANITATAVGFPPATVSVLAADTITFSANPLSVPAGTVGHLFLTLSAPAPPGGLVINLTSTATGIATVPPTVSFSPGSTSTSVPITGVGVGPATIKASNLPSVAEITASISVISGTPASITATGGASQSAAINTTYAPLVATVKDGGNNPISGVVVTFTAPGAGPSGTFAGGNTTTTNASGMATANFTANGLAGPFSVTASVAGVGTPATFSLNNTVSFPTITATGGGGTKTVNTSYGTLSALVKDAMGNPVGSGVIVTFSAPGSGPSGTFAGSMNTAMTTGAGIATSAIFTANTIAGSFTVTATAPGVVTPASYAFTNLAGDPFSITATSGTPQSAGTNTAFGLPLKALVKDSFNNPVPNFLVTFTAPPLTGASGTFAGGVNTAMTNALGIATSTTFTANANVGSYLVTAMAGVTSVSYMLSNVMGIQIPAGVIVGLNSTTPLQVTLGAPAPAGGVFITLSSSDTSKVGLMSSNVLIPAGQTSGNVVKLQGVALGSATITASAVGYPSVSQVVQTADILSFSPNTASITSGTKGIVFLSLSVPAPPGGLVVSLMSSNTLTATVPPTAIIPANSTSVGVYVTGVSPGPVTITAQSAITNTTTASVTIN